MKLVLTNRARADYKAIRAYSLREHGAIQARRYRQRFQDALARLLDFPAIGKRLASSSSGSRTISVGRHLIVYRIEHETVLILRILHERQLPTGI